VDAIRSVNGGYEISLVVPDGNRGTIACRRVVLAVSAIEAARLLEPLAPEATRIISGIECASLVVLNIGFKATDVGHPMQGYGFLVPHDEPDFPLLGVLWADSVFPQHAPVGHRLIRVFVGGSRDPNAADRSDEELLDNATASLRNLLDIKGRPILADVCRYPKAIPQYHVGHVEKIDRLQAVVADRPGLHLIGNYLRGISVNEAITFGTRTAQELIRETG
jgi:oxygen-dependent protoporphyrinogen oxidase